MLAAFPALAGVLSPLQTYNKAQPLRIIPKRYRYLEAEHTTSAIHSQKTSLLPINKIWAFSWGGMILRETLTLLCNNSHQHEQNGRENTQPPALRIKRHSCRETNQVQRDWPSSNCRQVGHQVALYHPPWLVIQVAKSLSTGPINRLSIHVWRAFSYLMQVQAWREYERALPL